MTAATITPQQMAQEAHAVLHEAMRMPARMLLAPGALCDAFLALHDALEAYGAIHAGAWHWESAYPHLREENVAEPESEALRKAAEEAAAAAEHLIAVMAERAEAPAEVAA